MERRFGDAALITYLDVDDVQTASEHADLIEDMQTRGLLYPVTVIDGEPAYDGAVSYPAILRAVNSKLETAAGVESA